MKYAGVADVRLLDGGFAAWAEAGYPVEQEVRLPQPVEFAAPVASHLLATTDYIRERLQNSRVWLADVRSVEEFTGRTSGYSYLEAKGRIPSAAHVGDGDDGAYLYKQRDGRLKPPAEILVLWQRQGIVAAKEGGRFEREVVFYCGGGWRSSVAFSMPGCWDSRTSETILMAGAVGARSIRPIRRRRAARPAGGNNPPATPWRSERHDHDGR